MGAQPSSYDEDMDAIKQVGVFDSGSMQGLARISVHAGPLEQAIPSAGCQIDWARDESVYGHSIVNTLKVMRGYSKARHVLLHRNGDCCMLQRGSVIIDAVILFVPGRMSKCSKGQIANPVFERVLHFYLRSET